MIEKNIKFTLNDILFNTMLFEYYFILYYLTDGFKKRIRI